MTEQKYWFKARRYGWGWYPATWQGWLIVLAYALLIVGGSFWLQPEDEPGNRAVMLFLLWTLIWTLVLIRISYSRGEKPGWHWGGKK